jgi:ELWxxDGT repeat protein
VLFVGTDPAHGAELWATDGRGAGTQRLADVCPGACSAFSSNVPPTVLGDATGRTYFLATPRADSDSQALWVTNGAPAGTLRISSFARGVGFLNGLVYFSAAAPDGLELRATDGKSGASHLVTVLQP